MKPIDCILFNALVITMDDDFHLYEPGAVAIEGENIVAVGFEKEIMQDYIPKNIIDFEGKVIMPGFINAHTHAPMTLLRGLADDLRLDVWLMGYMMPVEREFVSPDFVRLGSLLACAEMIRGGITTFADMYYFEEDVAKAVASAGMRAVLGQTVLKFPSPDAQFFEESLQAARDFIVRWKNHPLVIPSVAPHAPYTCTDEILRASSNLAIEFDIPLQIHLSETALEVENMRVQHGMPVIPYIRRHNLLDAKVIAAHCVHVDEGEIRTLLHVNAGIAHNPSSNLKLASGFAPVKRMIELGVNVGLGTDGPASNNDLDMFEEMRLASFIAKGTSGDPTALPARTVLLMATRLGAQALHLGDITGSIQSGKRADLISIEINSVHNSPRFLRDIQGIYAQLVFAAKSNDVCDVMINGKWVMREHQLLTLHEDQLIIQSQEYARKIDLFLIQREQSILSKLITIGGASEEESFEVQAKVPIRDPQPILEALKHPDIQILRTRHYRQYDTYFEFSDSQQGYLRYREDHFIEVGKNVPGVRSRLTLIGPVREHLFSQKVLLSRSRYLAPATQSLRFYREYFRPTREYEIEKDRQRFKVLFRDFEFYVNVDEVIKPHLGWFLEVKSPTWSRQDAETKSKLVTELIKILGASPDETKSEDYINMLPDNDG